MRGISPSQNSGFYDIFCFICVLVNIRVHAAVSNHSTHTILVLVELFIHTSMLVLSSVREDQPTRQCQNLASNAGYIYSIKNIKTNKIG